MDPRGAREQLLGWVEQHDRWRREDSISLLPSENILSGDVLRMVGSDMASRYSLQINAVVHGFYMDNAYGGTRLSDEVETLGEKLACEVFGSRFATLKPIGAHIAGMMAILGLTEKDDLILTIDAAHGGYDGYMPQYMPGFTGRRVPPGPGLSRPGRPVSRPFPHRERR